MGKKPQNEKNIKQIKEEIFSTITLSELKGLSLWEKADDVFSNGKNIYLFVIMGGSLKTMRRIYKKLLKNKSLISRLDKELPFIESNRIARFEEMIRV